RSRKLLLQAGEELAPVGDPGERVGVGELEGLLVEAGVGDGEAGLRRDRLGKADLVLVERRPGRTAQGHDAEDATLGAKRNAQERSGSRMPALVVQVARVALHVLDVDAAP